MAKINNKTIDADNKAFDTKFPHMLSVKFATPHEFYRASERLDDMIGVSHVATRIFFRIRHDDKSLWRTRDRDETFVYGDVYAVHIDYEEYVASFQFADADHQLTAKMTLG